MGEGIILDEKGMPWALHKLRPVEDRESREDFEARHREAREAPEAGLRVEVLHRDGDAIVMRGPCGCLKLAVRLTGEGLGPRGARRALAGLN